jgi:S-adenosylmethionine synthetase
MIENPEPNAMAKLTENYYFTSESVSMGHPDKVADQVSDAVLDSLLEHDPMARVACETYVTTGLVMVGGEITVHNTEAELALGNVEDVVRETVRKIGYTGDIGMQFDADNCGVIRTYHSQSADISMGVGRKKEEEQGAGDQGLMFGFACKETPDLMPLPIDISHKMVAKHAQVRSKKTPPIKGLRPDAKSQVTVEYDIDNKPLRIDAVVLSTQHTPDWNGDAKQAKLGKEVFKHIIEPCLPKKLYKKGTKLVFNPTAKTRIPAGALKVFVNPTGQFEIGGPHGDVGLTGRKIIVDTYGGRGRHGGGAFSGKDPSKVDRSAAYMARYIAKNLVKANLCDVCEVQLSYAIGVAEPTSVHIDTYKTGRIPEPQVVKLVRELFPLTPAGILKHLKLRAPIFSDTAAHGHFGRKPGKVKVGKKTHETFTWEKTDLADKLKKAAGL